MIRFFLAVILCSAVTGCTLPEVLPAVLGSRHYTDGGTHPIEKKRDLESKYEAWRDSQYQAY